ncbi:amino acid transporter [Pseudoscardovia radai]|uniref:Amino acid transporter n=1 Tax=Pseudoscardovia radai TaxID=987066 RepID=A0A261EZN3_9BIFI|nr:APC family permease [Pseudoscardovia radai]OZG52136.1 amino acid transporter [Pseudoscardovia radai]
MNTATLSDADAPMRPPTRGMSSGRRTGTAPAGNNADGNTRTDRPRGKLGTPAITMMVVAAAAPLTVLSGGTSLGILNGTGAGFPASFPIVGLALLLFSIGLSAMTRHVGGSGAFFTVIGHGLGPAWGLGASTLALFTYALIQAGICCFLGKQISISMQSLTGQASPWWAWSLLVAAIAGWLGYRNIAMSAHVLNILIAGEIAVTVILCAAIFARHASGTVDAVTGVTATGINFAASFSPSATVSGAPGVAIIFAIASFVGFESTAIYRSEARDPDITVPRATYTAVIFVTILYTASTFALVTAWCSAGITAETIAAFGAGDVLQVTATRYIGGWFAAVISVLIITSLFAAVLSFHNVLARYMQSMAQVHAMPARLATLDARRGSPAAASLVASAICVGIVVTVAITRLDPFTQAFSWFSGVAVLGFVTLLALTCIAVIVTFAHRADLRAQEGMWRSVVASAAGAVLLLAILVCSVANFPNLVGETDASGTPVFGGLCTALVACAAVALLAGIAEAAIMRLARPNDYLMLRSTLLS